MLLTFRCPFYETIATTIRDISSLGSDLKNKMEVRMNNYLNSKISVILMFCAVIMTGACAPQAKIPKINAEYYHKYGNNPLLIGRIIRNSRISNTKSACSCRTKG